MTALRPRDDSVSAIQAAIDAVAEERRVAEQRLVESRAAHANMLLDPGATLKTISALEKEIRDVSNMLERFDVLMPALVAKLQEAQLALQRTRMDHQVELAVAAIAEFRAALEDYPSLAEAIATICRLNRTAAAAVRAAQQAARARGGHLVFDLPGINGQALADFVVLPALSGGTIWGRGPAQTPVSIYARDPVVV